MLVPGVTTDLAGFSRALACSSGPGGVAPARLSSAPRARAWSTRPPLPTRRDTTPHGAGCPRRPDEGAPRHSDLARLRGAFASPEPARDALLGVRAARGLSVLPAPGVLLRPASLAPVLRQTMP